MTPEEILQGLYDETLVGNAPRVLELTHEALGMGMEPQSLLFDALIPSLEEVGARFERVNSSSPGLSSPGARWPGPWGRFDRISPKKLVSGKSGDVGGGRIIKK